MRHVTPTYNVRLPDGLIRQFLPDGKIAEVRTDTFVESLEGSTFTYAYLFGDHSQEPKVPVDALEALGAAMMRNKRPFRASCIPAGYTYLGQLIFHDLTFMAQDLRHGFGTPALDMESVVRSENTERFVPIGSTSGGQVFLEDIPRKDTDGDRGAPDIADERNDDFLPLAQCHLALLKFYNTLALRMGEEFTPAQVRRQWLLHIQCMVLTDYLPRIVGRSTHQAVLTEGRKLVKPTKAECAVGDTWMPMEFAVACGRFGHSMIRDNYGPWNAILDSEVRVDPNFLASSYYNAPDHLGGSFGKLRMEWIPNWFTLFDFTKGRYAGVARKPLMSGCIDANLTEDLGKLPERLRNLGKVAHTFNLAAASLKRGYQVGLASAQQAISYAHDCYKVDFRKLTEDEIKGEDPDVIAAIETHKELKADTPLWYYVLQEADKLGCGRHLGPLGGRIVMETVHAAIESSETSLLKENGWHIALPHAEENVFSMADLIAFSGDPDPLAGRRW
jgi:hypothetical protein